MCLRVECVCRNTTGFTPPNFFLSPEATSVCNPFENWPSRPKNDECGFVDLLGKACNGEYNATTSNIQGLLVPRGVADLYPLMRIHTP